MTTLPRSTQRRLRLLSSSEIWWARHLSGLMLVLSVLQVTLDQVQVRVLHQTLQTPLGLPFWANDLMEVAVCLAAWGWFHHRTTPLARSHRCREAWHLVRTSPGADAVRRHVLHLGRALTGEDLALMRAVARRERRTNPAMMEQERAACRRLHGTT